MNLQVSFNFESLYSKKGFLVKGESPHEWLSALSKCKIDISTAQAFPVPGKIANKIYGCFIITDELDTAKQLPATVIFQCVHNLIFIPMNSCVSPQISKAETIRLCKTPFLFHPDVDWVSLDAPLEWLDCISIKEQTQINVIKPMFGTVIPKTIHSIGAIPKDHMDIEKNLDLPLEKMKSREMKVFDSLKLGVFKTLFRSRNMGDGQFEIKERGFFKLFNRVSGNKVASSKWSNNMDKLLRHNSREADRLLAMFAKDPKLALRYAIPLDLLGSSRDSGKGLFSIGRNLGTDSGDRPHVSLYTIIIIVVGLVFFLKLMTNSTLPDFGIVKILAFLVVLFICAKGFGALSGSNINPGGSATIHDSRMEALRKQYKKIIEEEKKCGNHRKAAAMEIKLLKDHWAAARTLHEGKYFEEAAYIALKYNKDKHSAAQYYEDGKFYDMAITLCKELKQTEKVGDLYKAAGSREEANEYFEKVINDHIKSKDFIKAAQIYEDKIEDSGLAQKTLLNGWQERKQMSQTIYKYFDNIQDLRLLKKEILRFYEKETENANIRIFIKGLKSQKEKSEEIAVLTRNLMYEIVSKYHATDPAIAFELASFDAANDKIGRDSNIFVRETKKAKYV